MQQCGLCRRNFSAITNTHLQSGHRITIHEYTARFGHRGVGFVLSPSDLPETDPRYKKWRESLKKRPPPWNAGYTKETHQSIAKMVETFRKRGIDNFAVWREKARRKGLFPSHDTLLFKKSGNLAELIGVVLGDGHIAKFPRTEALTIAANSANRGFISRYEHLVEGLFLKKPYVARDRYGRNCTRIRIYQKGISKRLSIPHGNRSKVRINIPGWIWNNRAFLIRYLRGLYEAEGSFCVHKPTSTYKLLFSNRNPFLLKAVHRGLQKLGFHPHISKYKVQISKMAEVYACKELLGFRKY